MGNATHDVAILVFVQYGAVKWRAFFFLLEETFGDWHSFDGQCAVWPGCCGRSKEGQELEMFH